MVKKFKQLLKFKSTTFAMVMLFFCFLAVAIVMNGFFAIADPDGAQLSYVGNSTKGITTPGNRSTDAGGYIHTMNFNSTQQNTRWKAYVGNVTGLLVLDDSADNTIYDWTLSTVTGEVYATRASSVTWSSIGCAATSLIEGEDTTMGFSVTADDTINSTFSSTVHAQTVIAGNTITNSTCRAISTYVSDSPQASTETADFQELLLDDNTNMIYAALLEQDATGYDGSTFDFQMIVADNETTANTLYYFFVELG